MTPGRWLEKIRDFCLRLPGTVEKSSFGHPNFAAGRIYAAVEEYGGRPSVCVLSTKVEQARRVDGVRCFAPPYVAAKGWIGVWLDAKPAWREVAELLRAAHGLALEPRLRPPRRR